MLLGLLLPWRCFPLFLRGAAWFLPSLGGLSCLEVLPSIPSIGWGCFFPCLLLGFFPLWVVLLFSFSCCWVVLLGLLLLLGGVAFPLSFCVVLLGLLLPWRCIPLPLRGAAWFLNSLGGLSCLVVLPSSPLLGVAAFSHVFCWVVLLGFLLPCRCFPLLFRGAAWFVPSLGGLSCLVVLPSFSSFWWDCFIPRLLLGGAASPLGWCCCFFLLLLGGAAWSPLSFGWCCCFSFSCWVVLLGLLARRNKNTRKTTVQSNSAVREF